MTWHWYKALLTISCFLFRSHMHTAVQEMFMMGIWHKFLSQPLRYIYYLAGYVSPHRLRSGSPPFRPTPKPVAYDLYPLDVILNEQEPFHPLNVFSDSAMGHTRSFSTNVADRARRLPDRCKVRENTADKSSRTPARGASKRSRSDANFERRKPSRRLLKRQASQGEKPSTDTQTFSSQVLKVTSSSAGTERRGQGSVVPTAAESDPKYSSKSARLFSSSRFSLSEHAEELRQKMSVPIDIRTQGIKSRLWDTWIAREHFQGRLSSVQLFDMATRTDEDHQVAVCGLWDTLTLAPTHRWLFSLHLHLHTDDLRCFLRWLFPRFILALTPFSPDCYLFKSTRFVFVTSLISSTVSCYFNASNSSLYFIVI